MPLIHCLIQSDVHLSCDEMSSADNNCATKEENFGVTHISDQDKSRGTQGSNPSN